MDNTLIKKLLPHIGAYAIMLVLSFLFFLPYFQGKVLSQGDAIRAGAMQAEMRQVHDETGEWPKWTNSMFAGMPTYQIMQTGEGNPMRYIFSVLIYRQGVNASPFVVLLAMFCFYLLLVTLKVDWRIGLIGAIGYGLSTYNIDLAEAGHATKMVAMAYVPGVFAGALLAFRGRYLLGGSLFAFFFALNIYSNHLQITFYMGLLLLILGLIKLITAAKRGTLPSLAKATGVLAVAGLLALSSNLSRIWSTQEYTKETIRGKSELTAKVSQGKADGLDKDYIFAWSYGIAESFTLLVPNYMGGGASHHFRGTETHKRVYRNVESQMLQRGQSKEQAKKIAEREVASYFYWGNQPFVGTAIYFGVIFFFLFVLGAFLVKGDIKIWLIISAIFALTLSWGGNFFLNHFLVDYVPLFNKFRAVSMALGLSQLAMLILGMLGLSKLLDQDISVATKKKALYYSTGISAGLCLLGLLIGSGMDMSGAQDAKLGNLVSLVKDDRWSIMLSDGFRSIALILVAAGSIFLYLRGSLKALFLILIIGFIGVTEVWIVNKRVLFAEKFETPKEREAGIQPAPVDLEIQKDKDPHYRVADYARGNILKNANTSYFHKSIGGYHAAKLMVFQEVADRYFMNPADNIHILGMLNTKYLIFGQGGNLQYNRNPEALGNAWFVNSYNVVDNADAELAGLATLKPAEQLIVQKKYAQSLEGFNIQPDPSATIKLTSYNPDHMVYEYSANSDQLAVFSEVYYDPAKGWNMYLDGELIDPFFKANYLLRAIRLPAGQNRKLEMKFEPSSFVIGDKISIATSILLMLGVVFGVFTYFKKEGLSDPSKLEHADIVLTNKTKKPLTKTKSGQAGKNNKKKSNKRKK